MDIYALDAHYNVISVGIPYVNLQWTRRYYDFGEFTVQVALENYDPNWAFIGTPERPELGMVQKVFQTGSESVNVQISGFFCEKMLDDKTCYPRYIGDVAKTETAVRNIFTKYKDDLPITLEAANNPLLGDRTQSNFSDDELGTKLYNILEPRELSYSVTYDYVSNALRMKVWQGVDRTQSQSKNSYQVFSMEFANIGSRTVNIDESDYKNYGIVPCNGDDDNNERNVYYVDLSKGGYKKEIVIDKRGEHPDDGESMADFKTRMEEEGLEKLLGYAIVEDINVNPVSDAEYLVDYDLGDKCDVLFSDIGVELETRIVEIVEVFKASGHTLTIGLGNKRISNIRRLVGSL